MTTEIRQLPRYPGRYFIVRSRKDKKLDSELAKGRLAILYGKAPCHMVRPRQIKSRDDIPVTMTNPYDGRVIKTMIIFLEVDVDGNPVYTA